MRYIIYTMVGVSFFYITVGELDRMGTSAILRDSVVSGAYLSK